MGGVSFNVWGPRAKRLLLFMVRVSKLAGGHRLRAEGSGVAKGFHFLILQRLLGDGAFLRVFL